MFIGLNSRKSIIGALQVEETRHDRALQPVEINR